jgi:hypothetical protein
MYNIRIKQLPKNGDQRNYSLVDRNDLYIKVNPVNSDSNVKNTISAVPRDEANIEAEGGETVIGDINNDGFLEHSKIVGKRHTEGGVPLNVAPGSFIFSDTKKLKIKDPEVLSIFGISNVPKGGITPAKIAQKYPMNNYMNTMKSNESDPIAKRTATQMMKNNLEKLGMLALVQESMKGFPDGIPAIAESVMAGLQGQQSPGQEQGGGSARESMEGAENEMKYGGGYYQNAGTTKEKQKNKVTSAGNPVEGFKFYNGITPVTVTKVNKEYGVENPNSPYIELSNGERLTKKQFEQLLTKGYYNYIHGGIGDVYTINQNIQKRTLKNSSGNTVKGFDLYSGDKINFKGNDYTVVNPYADNSRGYYDTMKPLRDMFDNTQGIVQVRNNKTGQYEYIEGEDLADAYVFDNSQVPILPNESFRTAFKNNQKRSVTNPGYDVVSPSYASQNKQVSYTPSANNTINVTGETNLQPLDTTTVVNKKQVVKDNVPVKTAKNTYTPQRSSNTNIAPKTNTTAPVAKPAGVTTEYVDDEFEYGGTLPKHQGTQPGVPSTVQGPGPSDKTIVKWQINNKTGNKRPVYSDGTFGDIVQYDVADKDLRTEVSGKGYEFIDLKPEFRYQGTTVGHQTAESGYKVDNESGFLYKDIKPGTAGLENYMEIHSDAINAFPGGAEAWKKTMLATPGKENPAMTHLLNYQNSAIGLLSGDKPYVDLNKPGALVPGVENFNLPGVRKKPAPIEIPKNKEEEIIVNKIENKLPVKRRRPWWIQDSMNYAAAMTDIINYYPPAMSRVDLETPGYVIEDPDRQIAAMQEMGARATEAAMNSTAGNVAGASLAAQSDQRLGQSANIIAGVENRNAQIVNQALGRNAQITNQESILNENAKQKYIADSAIGRQNYDNALRELKYRKIKAWNNGTTNWMRHKQMEDVLFPNVGIDSITGDVYFPGGRQAFDAQGREVYDPYINPANPNDTSSLSKRNFEERYNYWTSKGLSPEDASRNAHYEINKQGAATGSKSDYGQYMAANQTLPQETKYGGRIKKQYGGVVFDFGALPLYFFED